VLATSKTQGNTPAMPLLRHKETDLICPRHTHQHTPTCALVTHKETKLQGKTATRKQSYKERQLPENRATRKDSYMCTNTHRHTRTYALVTHSYMCTRETQGKTATRKDSYMCIKTQGKTDRCGLGYTRIHSYMCHSLPQRHGQRSTHTHIHRDGATL